MYFKTSLFEFVLYKTSAKIVLLRDKDKLQN